MSDKPMLRKEQKQIEIGLFILFFLIGAFFALNLKFQLDRNEGFCKYRDDSCDYQWKTNLCICPDGRFPLEVMTITFPDGKKTYFFKDALNVSQFMPS